MWLAMVSELNLEMGQMIDYYQHHRRTQRLLEKGSKKDYVSHLPTEIIEKILIHLDGKQLCKCRLICSRWRDIITQSDFLWQAVCQREMGIFALKAQVNGNPNMLWFHIYRNLRLWPHIDKYKTKFSLFSMIPGNNSDVSTGDLNQGILVINGNKSTKLIDVNRNAYKLIIINGVQVCERIVNTNNVSVLQLKENKCENSCLYVERTVQASNISQDAVFKDVKMFVINNDELYYCTNRNAIYVVDLHENIMAASLYAYIINLYDTGSHYHPRKQANKEMLYPNIDSMWISCDIL